MKNRNHGDRLLFSILFKPLFLFLIGLLSSLFIYSIDDLPPGFENLYLIPVVFGLLHLIFPSMSRNSGNNIGLFTLNLLMLLRYILTPIILALSKGIYYIGIDLDELSTYSGINLILYEMIAIFIAIGIFSNFFYEGKNNQVVIVPLQFKSKFLLYMIVLLGLCMLLIFPQIINVYSIVPSNAHNISVPKSTFTNIAIIIFGWAKVILPLLLIGFFKHRYDINNQKLRYIVFSCVIIVLNMLFMNANKAEALIVLLSYMMLARKLFPKYRSTIEKTIMTTGILVGGIIFLVKSSLGTDDTNSITGSKIGFASTMLQAYLSGPHNLGVSVLTKYTFDNFINSHIIIDDLFFWVPFINRFVDSTNTSSGLFNYVIYQNSIVHDQVIPMAGQSLLYFGYIGAPLLSIASILIMMYLDYKIRYENRLEFYYILNYSAIYFGAAPMLYNVSIMLGFIIGTILPLVFIYKINSLLNKNEKNNKSTKRIIRKPSQYNSINDG